MIRRGRKAVLAGGVLLVAAALTSCIKVDTDIELDDGRASGEIVLAVSQQFIDLADGAEPTVFDEFDIPEGATVEPYNEDGYVGERYILDDTDVTELDEPEFSITYDEGAGQYEVDGAMDFTVEDTSDVPPGVIDDFEVSVSVTFSGDVIEHNGELDGNTVTWQPEFGEITELYAVGEEDPGAPAWLSDVLGVLAVLSVVGLVAVLVYRRSTQDVRAEGAVPVLAGRVATGALGRHAGPDEITQDLPTAADDAAQGVTRRPASDGTTRDLTDAADAAARDVTQGPPDDLPQEDTTPDGGGPDGGRPEVGAH